MKLSNETIDILNNFSAINDSLYFREGSKLRTVSPMKNIYAEAEVKETFEMDFGIYSLKLFLSIINALDNPSLTFHENHVVISDDKFSIQYLYASENMIVTPPKGAPKGSGALVEFNIEMQDWKSFKRALNVVGSPDIVVEATDDNVTLKGLNTKNSGDNVLNMNISNANVKENCKVHFLCNNMVMMDKDYSIEVHENIAKFSTIDNLLYVIAAEDN